MVYVETSRTKKKNQIIINHITFFEELEFCIPIFKSILKYINMCLGEYEINFEIVLWDSVCYFKV